MKYKTNKLRKLENNRFSIITEDLEHCILCDNPSIEVNEIFPGRNRINSMKYGLCIPLCKRHHSMYHIDRNMQLYYMKKGLDEFLKEHTKEEFQNTFKYIKGLDIF